MKQETDLFAKSSANLLFSSSDSLNRDLLEKEVLEAKKLAASSARKYTRSSERKKQTSSAKKFSIHSSTIENSAEKHSLDNIDRKFELK